MRSIACFKRSLDALDASKSIIQAQMKELPREELHHLRTPSHTVYLISADAPIDALPFYDLEGCVERRSEEIILEADDYSLNLSVKLLPHYRKDRFGVLQFYRLCSLRGNAKLGLERRERLRRGSIARLDCQSQ